MQIRTWYRLHRWLGIAIALPVIVVAVTGILLVHAESLGLKGQEEVVDKPAPEEGGRTFPDFNLQSGPDCVSTVIPIFEAAESDFRDRFGEVPLKEVELKDEDEKGGWVVKFKTQPTS
ncbi:MAG: hypothetical protein D6741_17785, partial [Planctomycetota bacterium]